MKQEEIEQKDILKGITDKEYEYGFVSDIDIEDFPKGLNEDIVRRISQRKGEPDWLLEFRLKAYRYWTTLEEPDWGHLDFEKPNYQDIRYLAIPKKKKQLASMDEVDPELVDTFNKLGINLEEQKVLAGVAVDAVMDSVSVKTTFSDTLKKYGIIFCSFGEAVREHPDLVRQYLGTVVPYTDNFFAALNSAVFSEGSFCYIPKGVRCPIELSTYFRINAANTGQFERTLLIADEGAYVSYMEGCTAPQRDENQLHAAVVELIAIKDAEIKYSTVQNWYPGDKNGKGGIYNLVTKRGLCKGANSKISWTQVETGSAVTWKYPGCILKGDNSVGEFYSVAVTNTYQQADTGTKMIHLGRNTRSTIIRRASPPDTAKIPTAALSAWDVMPTAPATTRRATRCSSATCAAPTRSLHGRAEPHGDGRTRGDYVENQRGPTPLLQPARHLDRGRRGPHRQRLRQGRAQQTPHGICRRSPETPASQSRGNGGIDDGNF